MWELSSPQTPIVNPTDVAKLHGYHLPSRKRRKRAAADEAKIKS